MYSQNITNQIPKSKAEKMPFLDEEELNGIAVGDYTLLELHAAFDLIKDNEHYKNPVHATIPREDFAITSVACSFFTGSALDIAETTDTHYVVEAEGYFAAMGE